jgi:hypothetical protein
MRVLVRKPPTTLLPRRIDFGGVRVNNAAKRLRLRLWLRVRR